MVAWFKKECGPNIVEGRTNQCANHKRTRIDQILRWPVLHGTENQIGIAIRPGRKREATTGKAPSIAA